MSRGESEIPSNHELAQRTQRIETQVEHVAETVDRIENNMSDNQEEITHQVEENAEKVDEIWTAYRLMRWLIPLLVGGSGLLGYLRFLM